MINDSVDHLEQLGRKTEYKYDSPSKDMLEVFENKFIGRKYKVLLNTCEFTSLCPRTGQPDYVPITIEYIPDKCCIETKSLKLYLFSYRNHGSFMETITNNIMEDIVAVCNPLWISVRCNFNSRGGINLNVNTEYTKDVYSS